MYWAHAGELNQPVLIADNMALQPDLRNDLSIRDNIVEWMPQLGQQVAGKETPIFMGKTLNFISLKGLDGRKDLTLSVIGDTDNHRFYANALEYHDQWVDISKSHTKELLVLSK